MGRKTEKPFTISLKRSEPSPCSAACPLGTNVKAYVSLISAGRFIEALESVRRLNPFPGICGRVCPHPCEKECVRGDSDAPLSIAVLKRFIADFELRLGVIPGTAPSVRDRGKAAVIGAGPSGLTCAADLARAGMEVTVFEALPVAGGMMAVGIPAYRLPRDILRVEIGAIRALGVDIRLNMRVGTDIMFEDIADEFGYVYIATGAHSFRDPGFEGAGTVTHGIQDPLSFLRSAALGKGEKPGTDVVVVGGGNTAVDCARTAVRLGADRVRLVYRRSAEEMPAYGEEVEFAEEEGVEFIFLASPVKLLSDGGRLTGIECVRMHLGETDETGRKKPVPVENSEFVIHCDTIIPGVGQEPDTGFLEGTDSIGLAGRRIEVDTDTMATGRQGVYAGGDAVTGPANIIEGIAAGHAAACSILRAAGVEPSSPAAESRVELVEECGPPPNKARIEAASADAETRKQSFDEITAGLKEAQAAEEAERCIRCGPCSECDTCVAVCSGRQVILEQGDSTGPAGLARISAETHRKIAEHGSARVSSDTGEYTAFPFTVRIDEEMCRGCGVCEQACPYNAVQVLFKGDGIFTACVNEDICRGCGICAAVCPTGAAEQGYFSDEYMDSLLSGIQGSGKVVFRCWWSPQCRVSAGEDPVYIDVMCAGRVNPGDIMKAFEKGAEQVTVIGCMEEGCRYGTGFSAANENLRRVSDILYMLGFDTGQFRVVEQGGGS